MRWAPQLEVLRDAAAFVTHGGLNSIHEALVFGVPMVVAPHQFEQAINAQRVADLGAGLCLRERLSGRAITAEQLRAALDAVLQRPSYRRNAERLGARLRVLCGYRNAADELQALMARARSKGFHRRARARA
jgi:MGT family glycosyltransferase